VHQPKKVVVPHKKVVVTHKKVVVTPKKVVVTHEAPKPKPKVVAKPVKHTVVHKKK
jgi:hypothetical protein